MQLHQSTLTRLVVLGAQLLDGILLVLAKQLRVKLDVAGLVDTLEIVS